MSRARLCLAAGALALLAACGADGLPEPPGGAALPPGISVSADVAIGVTGRI